MTRRWNWAIAGGAVGLLLSGGVLERLAERVPSRAPRPVNLEASDARRAPVAPDPGPSNGAATRAAWLDALREADGALQQGKLAAAARAVRHAHGLALASPRWEALLAVGDAYRRMGEAAGVRGAWWAGAREAYLAAFFRARRQDSLIGVLMVGDAFDALGDREVAERARQVAVRLQATRGDIAPDRRGEP
jgi:hypothetical protein